MNDQEILEMYRRDLKRVDFSEDDKAAKRKVARRLMEKMGMQTCAYGVDYCVEEGTRERMKDIFFCEAHHASGSSIACCARCSKCFAWTVLIGRTSNPEPMVYEFTCGVKSCNAKNLVRSEDTRWVGLQNPVIDRGYFYDGNFQR
jgi:hypothetical protein